MITLALNDKYDLFVDTHGNIATQTNELYEIAQTLMNRCSLVRGEDSFDSSNGISLDIIFGQDYTLDDRKSEIRRVILLDDRVVSVEQIEYKFDPKTRNGFFTPTVKVSLSSGEQKLLQFNLAV